LRRAQSNHRTNDAAPLRPAGADEMAIVFFHQNEVLHSQGGIERYLSTLLDQAGPKALLVTEATPETMLGASASRIFVPSPLSQFLPKWLSYILGVILKVSTIARAIERLGPCTLEFSRPEYGLFSWRFKGTKVFTLHGTGPARTERLKYWIHRLSCLLLPFAADIVQIVGRDNGALTPSILARLSPRIRYIDAWYDEAFRLTPFQDLDGPLRVFYAGRLAPMKNPELLFKVIESAKCEPNCAFEFRYFGADGAKISDGPLKQQFPNFGLLDARKLADAIAQCHVGILCSGYGEGSPFIVVESLACGRGFVLPPLPGLIEAYRDYRGIMFSPDYTVSGFVATLAKMRAAIRNGLTPDVIASDVRGRSKGVMARQLLRRMEADHH
jgi:glycosyltransferase involved in cell wall biosynthesis